MPDKCPECGDPWDGHQCNRCGLCREDVLAAEEFYDSLVNDADSPLYDKLLDSLLNQQQTRKAPK